MQSRRIFIGKVASGLAGARERKGKNNQAHYQERDRNSRTWNTVLQTRGFVHRLLSYPAVFFSISKAMAL